MKKIILVLSMLSLVTISFAQIQRDAPPSRDTTKKMSGKNMADELGLNKDQRVQWKQIQQNNKAQKEAIQNNDSLSVDQKKAKLKELRKATAQSIDAILTDDQKQKYQQLKEEEKSRKAAEMNNQMDNKSTEQPQ